MIKNTGNRYITWKYWHAPYLHAQSLGVIAAYDMYIECCEGNLDASWAIDVKNRMTFAQFRTKLSEQMLCYNPVDNLYPGDNAFRISTRMPEARRKSGENGDARVGIGPSADGVTMEQYQFTLESGRLCTTVDEIREHFRSVYNDKGNNRQPCEACGTQTTWRCGLCEKAMCTTTNRVWTGNKCILAYHSHDFFGLSRSDRAQLEGKDVRTWTPPSNIAVSKNAEDKEVEEGDSKQYNQWCQGQVVDMDGLVKINCFACIVQQGTCNSSIINSLSEWGNTS